LGSFLEQLDNTVVFSEESPSCFAELELATSITELLDKVLLFSKEDE
jgi:hypothetical protein